MLSCQPSIGSLKFSVWATLNPFHSKKPISTVVYLSCHTFYKHLIIGNITCFQFTYNSIKKRGVKIQIKRKQNLSTNIKFKKKCFHQSLLPFRISFKSPEFIYFLTSMCCKLFQGTSSLPWLFAEIASIIEIARPKRISYK